MVVRARRVQGKSGDTVVKLRPLAPDELREKLRLSSSLTVEVDAMPGGYVCSASLKGKADAKAIREATSGTTPLRGLFSKEQRRFLEAHVPDGVGWGELTVLGPIFVLKLNMSPADLGRRLVVELWFYPDGSRILELSTKCTAKNAFQVAAESRAFLVSRGINLDGKQQTKTKAALTFFSKELRAAGEA